MFNSLIKLILQQEYCTRDTGGVHAIFFVMYAGEKSRKSRLGFENDGTGGCASVCADFAASRGWINPFTAYLSDSTGNTIH